jgi:DNA-binding beta-propeller fold protein YncE
MKKNLAALAVPLFFSIGMAAGPVFADGHSKRLFIDRDVDTFAVLPDGVRFPEGITASPANGDIYVATFDGGNQNKVLRYNRQGHLVATRDFGITPLLGLEFDRTNNKVYVLNVGDFTGVPGLDSKIQRIAADFNSITPIEDVAVIPRIGAPGPRDVPKGDGSKDTVTFGDNARVPNAMVLDSHGSLYVSDSFQGAIFKITNVAGCSKTCNVDTFSHDPLLATPGFPPFGANGLAFNKDESALFIANTGDDRVLKLEMVSGLRKVTVFAESLNGADGLVFDKDSGLLWVCTNQADEVVALNANGRIVAKLGEFRGIKRDGTPDGLLFPASPVIVGDEIFVTNLAIALTEAKGDEPEEDVTRWTVSRMRLPHRED